MREWVWDNWFCTEFFFFWRGCDLERQMILECCGKEINVRVNEVIIGSNENL